MDFGPRGRQITRLEGFSDAVFGFALTLLVVSLEVPRTYDELVATMRGFGGFACCFAVVSWIWYEHNLFFRRYGLQDGFTITLNLILLFVVLFYVYPLKFIFSNLLGGGTMAAPSMGGRNLLLIYSIALIVLFLVFALLYWHAHRQRARLELDRLENFGARTGMFRHLLTAAIGVLSVGIALSFPRHLYWAGWIYFLLGPVQGFFGWARGVQREKLVATT